MCTISVGVNSICPSSNILGECYSPLLYENGRMLFAPTFNMPNKIQINNHPYIFYQPEILDSEIVLENAKQFYQKMDTRRSVREFSDKPVSQEVIEQIILTASSAPSGAHKQPWTFVAVQNPLIKSEIRKAAEKEEYESYQNRMTDEWLDD